MPYNTLTTTTTTRTHMYNTLSLWSSFFFFCCLNGCSKQKMVQQDLPRVTLLTLR